MSLHDEIMRKVPSSFSLPVLEHELNELSFEIDHETDEHRKDWLCAAYQALNWARCPDGFAPPSQYGIPDLGEKR